MRFQTPLKVEIEIGRIDADEHVRRVRDQAATQLAADADDFQKMPQHFEIAAHREFFQREPHLHAGGFHARPADADDPQVGHQLAQSENQLAAEQIARCLAGHYPDGAPAPRMLSG